MMVSLKNYPQSWHEAQYCTYVRPRFAVILLNSFLRRSCPLLFLPTKDDSSQLTDWAHMKPLNAVGGRFGIHTYAKQLSIPPVWRDNLSVLWKICVYETNIHSIIKCRTYTVGNARFCHFISIPCVVSVPSVSCRNDMKPQVLVTPVPNPNTSSAYWVGVYHVRLMKGPAKPRTCTL